MSARTAGSSLEFAWEGVAVRAHARGTEAIRALGRLAEDFENFNGDPAVASAVLELHLTSPRGTARARGVAFYRAAACRIFGFGQRRDCEYIDGTLLLSRRGSGIQRFEVFGDQADGIHESAYEAILSAMGEAHDRMGIHRVHALGLEGNGKAGLLILPSGGGKSTLAALIARDSRCRILSEETPLVTRAGVVLPFPLRLAISPDLAARYFPDIRGRVFPRRRFLIAKHLFPLHSSLTRRPARPSFLMLGGLERTKEASITPVSRATVLLELFVSLVVGYGVAQMKEHLVRTNSIAALVRIAFSRFSAAVSLAATVPAYRLRCSSDPERTIEALNEFLALEGLSQTDIIPVGHDHPQPPYTGSDLLQAVSGADLGESQIPLPADDRGLPLGGVESADSVRGSKLDL